MDIVEVDVHDDVALRAFHAVEAASIAADRPQAVTRTYDALAFSVRVPGTYSRRTLLAARRDGETVGCAELSFALQDNPQLADVELHVRPDQRRRGVATALWHEVLSRSLAEGRTTQLVEVFVPAGARDEQATSAGSRFAEAMGFSTAHVEEHLVLDLPVPESRREALTGLAGASARDYEIVTWGDRCPDELVDAYLTMKTRMSNDVPIGDIDYAPVVYTPERLRTEEERTARNYRQILAAARRRSDGEFGGYTQVFLGQNTDQAIQDDTLVMPEHRGHRLGTSLKLVTLDILITGHPDRRSLHTWTDPENHAMARTNRDFGYAVSETMLEMQRRDAEE